MTRTATFGAAFALLLSSAAFAQTNPPLAGEQTVPPPVDQIAPSAETPLMSAPEPREGMAGEDAMESDLMGSGERMDRDAMRRHMRGDDKMRGDGDRRGRRTRDWSPGARQDMGRGHEMHGGRHWRDHHGGRRTGRGGGNDGAVFRFSHGDGGPSFRIKCAARDTTEDCAEAIMPMLDRLMPQQPAMGQ